MAEALKVRGAPSSRSGRKLSNAEAQYAELANSIGEKKTLDETQESTLKEALNTVNASWS